MSDEQNKPQTYPHELPDGRTVRVTVPDDPAEPAKELADLLQACMSPEAVAVIATMVARAKTDGEQVNREVAWFAGKLTEMVGGVDQRVALVDGIWLRTTV